MRKITKKKIAPIVITVLVVLYMIPLIALLLAALGGIARETFLLTALLLAYAFLGGAVIVGVIRALLQRLDEIDGGEEEEASQY